MLHQAAWTIADFGLHRCDAEITCAHCGRRVVLKPFDLEELFPRPTPVMTAALRFRCKRCKLSGAAISAMQRRR